MMRKQRLLAYLLTIFVLNSNVLNLEAAPPADVKSSAPESFADTVEKVSPAVVSIFTTQVLKEKKVQGLPQGFQKFPGGSPFEDFFKDFFDPRMQGGQRERKATALGSGVIIDSKEGYIVTAAHVIADAEKIMVTLSDDTELEAKVIGKDKRRDIALLKVTREKPLPVANFGDSAKLRQGDWAIAIGNPHNLGNTVTVGVISSKARDLGSKSRNIEATQFIDDFIQTDAAVNQGNSGGPLFNIAGEVIGINVVILSETGGSIGLGFAVPSNTVQNIIEQLKKYGHTREGRIGVEIQPVSQEIADSVNLGKAKGAMVTRVFPDSPAEKGGMKVQDIIIKVGDKDIKDQRSARKIISESMIGVATPLVVWRDGKEFILNIIPEEIPEADKEPIVIGEDLKEKSVGALDVLGMKLQKMSPDLRSALKLDDKINGVVVVDVEKLNPDTETLLRGDVIIQVDSANVTDPKEIADKIEAKKKDEKNQNLLFQIYRGGHIMFVALNVADKKSQEKK